MDILVPKNIFLRVADKFVPHFIDKDKAVASSPTEVYKKLFRASSDTGKSTLSQKHLSDRCKLSVRTVQYSLHRLSNLGYIRVDHEAGGCNTYVLLLSEYVMRRLEGYDRIDRSNWYPRPEQSCAKPARVDQPADAPAIPLQNVQGGYAKAAHPSYNVDKNSKNITPPTPFPTPQPFRGGSSASSEGIGGGDSISCPKEPSPHASKVAKADLQALFLQLWAVWPVKNDFVRARKVFFALAQAGTLPPMDELLAIVANYKALDSRWKNGYARWLSNWLRGHCWREQPLVREAKPSPHVQSTPQPSEASPEARAAATLLQSQVEDITQRLQQPIAALPTPDLPSWLTSTADGLCALWPKPASRTPVQAFLRYLLSSGTTPNTANLLAKAKEYLQESLQPMPLVNWLRYQHEELCL